MNVYYVHIQSFSLQQWIYVNCDCDNCFFCACLCYDRAVCTGMVGDSEKATRTGSFTRSPKEGQQQTIGFKVGQHYILKDDSKQGITHLYRNILIFYG